MASEKLRKVIGDREIAEIAKEIVSWEEFSCYLGISEAEVQEIKEDFTESRARKSKVLKIWRSKNIDRATYENLIKAAKESGNEALACAIRSIIGVPHDIISSVSPPSKSPHPKAATTMLQGDLTSTGAEATPTARKEFVLADDEANPHLESPSLDEGKACAMASGPEQNTSADSTVAKQDSSVFNTIQQLQNNFSSIYREVKQVLRRNGAGAYDVYDIITSRPPEEVKEHETFLQKMARNMGAFNLDQFMLELRKYIEFFDCKLLKEVVREYASQDLLKRIDDFEKRVEQFCKRTNVISFARNWKGKLEMPENFTELKAKLNFNPSEVTLHGLQELGRRLCRRFAPRLFDLCSMVIHDVGEGSIICVWRIPRKIVPELTQILLKQNELKKFLIENNFMKLSVDFQVLFSYEAEQTLQSFMELNPAIDFVNREVFYHSRELIRPLLNNRALLSGLKKYDMLWSDDDVVQLTSPYELGDAFNSLVQLVERQGEYGFMLLYRCILESCHKANTHFIAIQKLDAVAHQKKIEPPWQRSGIALTTPELIGRHLMQCSILNELDAKGDDDEESDPGFVDDSASTAEPTEQCSIQTVSELRESFAELSQFLLRDLINHAHAEELRKVVTSLPLSLNSKTNEPISTDIDQIENISKLSDLFHYFHHNLWNFFDHKVLEHIIEKLGSDSIKDYMSQYRAHFKEFEENTSLESFFESWPGRSQTLKGYTEVMATINSSLLSYRVVQINQLHKFICDKYLPPLSQFAMLYYKPLRENGQLTWILPSELAMTLKEAINQPGVSDYIERKFHVAILVCEDNISPETSLKPNPSEKGPYTGMEYYNYENANSDSSSSESSSLTPTNEPVGFSKEPHPSLPGAVNSTELRRKLEQLQQDTLRLTVTFNKRQSRNRAAKTDKGCYPCITLNNAGVVLEVNHQQGTNWMFCRVGNLRSWGIKWGHPALAATPKKVFYGCGHNPQVCLNDSNLVVEVHKGQFLDRCFIRLGEVDPSAAMITWSPSTYFNVGLCPAVAVNNSNTVVAIFQDNVFTKHLNYRVGQISRDKRKGKMAVSWKMSKQNAKVMNANTFSVDINDGNLVVLSYQNLLNQVHYKVGKIVQGSISWTRNISLSYGFTPSVSINNKDEVILVHQSLINRRLVVNVGMATFDDAYKGIIWSRVEGAFGHRYCKGLYPSVALNNSRQVVEVHEPHMAPNRNRLYYYKAELIMKN